MILNIDTEIKHKLLIMIPQNLYHKNKRGFKEIRTRHGFTDWHGCSWSDGCGKIKTYFQKRYEATGRWSNYDGDVLIIESYDKSFVNSCIIFWETRGGSVLDITDRPQIEVLVNGQAVSHQVME